MSSSDPSQGRYRLSLHHATLGKMAAGGSASRVSKAKSGIGDGRVTHQVTLVELPDQPWPETFEVPDDPLFEVIPPWTSSAAHEAARELRSVLNDIDKLDGSEKIAHAVYSLLWRGFHVLGCHADQKVRRLSHKDAFLLPGSRQLLDLLGNRAPSPQPISEAINALRYCSGVLLGRLGLSDFKRIHDTLDPWSPPVMDWYDHSLSVSYDATRPRGPEYAHVLSQLRPILLGRSVLEIGAGTGRTMRELAAHAASYTATEFSSKMLDQLAPRARAAGVTAVRADAMLLPFPDHSFDVVIEENSFAFVQEPLVAVVECLRVLREGGVLLRISSKQYHPGRDELMRSLRETLVDLGHHRVPIWGKAEHARIDRFLLLRGIETDSASLGQWGESYRLADVVTGVRLRALPYLALAEPGLLERAESVVFDWIPDQELEVVRTDGDASLSVRTSRA